MNWDIRKCKNAVEGWKGDDEYGLFIDGFLISAFTRGSTTEFNIDQTIGKGITKLNVGMKINHEVTLVTQTRNPENIVYDLFFNDLHVSRFAKGSFAYQNVLKLFDIKPPEK